jgi:hypothetical protein
MSTVKAERIAVMVRTSMDGGSGWFNGFLIACGCLPGARTLAAAGPGENKLGMEAFSAEIKRDQGVVKSYLEAWDAAAADDLVPYAVALMPDDADAGYEFDARHTAEKWLEYYDAASESRREAKRKRNKKYQEWANRGTNEGIEKAILTDPEVEEIARNALVQKSIERQDAAPTLVPPTPPPASRNGKAGSRRKSKPVTPSARQAEIVERLKQRAVNLARTLRDIPGVLADATKDEAGMAWFEIADGILEVQDAIGDVQAAIRALCDWYDARDAEEAVR